MKTKFIIESLFNKYKLHKYQIENSYIYSWESDFFTQSSSGYHNEFEVKVSRSDFFADFNKTDKHIILEKKKTNQSIVLPVHKMYRVCEEIEEYDLKDNRRQLVNGKYKTKLTGKYKSYYTPKDKSKIKNVVSYEESHTVVRIVNSNVPNKFYYVCPENLIKVEEIPSYAGLLYVSDTGVIRVIKNAPFIHKEKQNLTKILLDKFYWRNFNLVQKNKMLLEKVALLKN